MTSIRSILRDERGSSLPEALVTVIVSLVALVGMAFAVNSFVTTEQAISNGGQQNTQLSITDSTFRSDAEWATSIVNESSTTVTFIAPTSGGGCKSDVWTLNPGSSSPQPSPLTLQTTTTDTMAAGGASCTGTTISSATQTMIADVGTNASFTFSNLGGNIAVFSGGTESLQYSTAQPTTVDNATWSSTQIGDVVLNGSLNPQASNPTAIRISQVLLQVPRAGQGTYGLPASS